LPKKKIAEQEAVVAVERALAAAPAKATKAPTERVRALRASTKAVTHKRTKATISETPGKPAGVEVAAPVAEPTREEIARLAYSYWEARGYDGGPPDEDWLRAVNELHSR
jgi:uncharacterized membrane protein